MENLIPLGFVNLWHDNCLIERQKSFDALCSRSCWSRQSLISKFASLTLHFPSTQTLRSTPPPLFGGLWTFVQCVPSTAYSFNRAKYFWFTGRQFSSHSASSRTAKRKTQLKTSGTVEVLFITFDVWLPLVRLPSERLLIKFSALLRAKVCVRLGAILGTTSAEGREWDLCDTSLRLGGA